MARSSRSSMAAVSTGSPSSPRIGARSTSRPALALSSWRFGFGKSGRTDADNHTFVRGLVAHGLRAPNRRQHIGPPGDARLRRFPSDPTPVSGTRFAPSVNSCFRYARVCNGRAATDVAVRLVGLTPDPAGRVSFRRSGCLGALQPHSRRPPPATPVTRSTPGEARLE
jgi:hypothetical protein